MGRGMLNKTIRVVLVDDHPVVLHGITKLIEEENDIVVCGKAVTADEAIRLIETFNPDVAIVDIYLGGQASGIDLLKAIHERYPQVVTMVLSMHEESTYAERAIRAGARGYIPKNEAPKEIVEAIRLVMKGELYLSKRLSDKIITKLITGDAEDNDSQIATLTDRECEIFHMVGNGMETREIAQKLNLSMHTIESHRRNIKEKLRIKTNADFIKTAVEWVLAKN